MMLFTVAKQLNIDPDRTLQLAIETTYTRCANKRRLQAEQEAVS